MSPLLAAALVGFIAGPLGGAIAAALGSTALRSARDSVRAAALAFAGGFILAVAFMELIRRGVETPGQWSIWLTLGGIALGTALRVGAARLASDHAPRRAHARREPDAGRDDARRRATPAAASGEPASGRSSGTAAADGAAPARRIAVSLAVANLLEGTPVGIGFAVSPRLGLLIGGIMVVDSFAEALAVSTELAQRRREPGFWHSLLLSSGPTATLGVGALIGAAAGGLPRPALAALLGAAGGVLLYAVMDDIVFDAHKLAPGAVSTLPLLAGVMAGVALGALGGA